MAGAVKKDLLSLLFSYANGIKKPCVNVEQFLSFLEKACHKEGAQAALLAYWATDTRTKVMDELDSLEARQKITFTSAYGAKKELILPDFFQKLIEMAYTANETLFDQPFPDSNSLHLSIPESDLRTLEVDASLQGYLMDENPGDDSMVKLLFSDNFGDTITLASYLDEKLLIMALDKIYALLPSYAMTDYYQQRASSQFPGRDSAVREYFRVLTTGVDETLTRIRECNDFTFSFLSYLCQLIKKSLCEEIERLGRKTDKETVLYQSFSLVAIYVNHYKILEINHKKKEAALELMMERLGEPPLMFTKADMLKFVDEKGDALVGPLCTREDFEAFLQARLNSGGGQHCPDVVCCHPPAGDDVFVLKTRIFELAGILIDRTTPAIKAAIERRWTALLRNFDDEQSMFVNSEFEMLLNRLTQTECPVLAGIRANPQVQLAWLDIIEAGEEVPRKKGVKKSFPRLFTAARPSPFSTIYSLQREKVLRSCRTLLPFWYSFKPLVSLIKWFRRGNKKNASQSGEGGSVKNAGASTDPLIASAMNVAKELTGEKDIKTVMDSLRERWNHSLDPGIRKKTAEDVDAIIRDNARFVVQLQRSSVITKEKLDDAARALIAGNSGLSSISAQDDLRRYAALYLVHLILEKKF